MMPARRAAMALLFAVACFDPASPRSGVPTLDDPVAGPWIAVSAGWQHTCALAVDSTAWCWGSNEFGQLGVPDDGTACVRDDRDVPCQRRPVMVGGGIRFRAVSAGGVHSCGLAQDERIYCWGDNVRGALGDPTPRRSDTPIPALTTARFSEVVTGGEHTCGLRVDGAAVCWGANEYGQVGSNALSASVPVPATASGATLFVELSAGGARTCGRAVDNSAWCWGRTYVTRLSGQDVIRPQSSPARVLTNLVFTQLAGGATSTCGITTTEGAVCWEANSMGTVGNGTVTGALTPQPVLGEISFVALGSATEHSCGLATSGQAWCWGSGAVGELGHPAGLLNSICGPERVPCSVIPVKVSGYRQYIQLSSGQGKHSCALTGAGNVYCWGGGEMGQRGDGRVSTGEWSPVKVVAPQGLVRL